MLRMIRRRPVFLALWLLPVALIAAYWVAGSMRRHAFYEKHKLLKEIDEVERGIDPLRTTSIILKRIPFGTTRPDAIHVISLEGFDCVPFKRTVVDCFLESTEWLASFSFQISTGRRWIRLDFDDGGKLVDARELLLK
jgi:hypothetical protein